ncbi:hypothetical protein Forpi1262_v007154 [Fusarium oxysporum f. sp. raphani]|uniref:Uncharacterized protein n=1 Tax=Fusarium oxysporum f. sp. raphani TaxID=96318 RepID=A0A8J5UNE4_FUSOX|nr:hypothetical protein Forpi1262_v007154 [Fusarium oxysporum f. sp. raphani]
MQYAEFSVPDSTDVANSTPSGSHRDPTGIAKFGSNTVDLGISSNAVPLYFKAKVEFSLVLNTAMLQAYTSESEQSKAWYRTLPGPLLPSNIVFPSQLKLHGSPPLLLDQDELQKSLAKYRAYFETILRIHYLRHSFEYGNMMLTRFLAMLAFLALTKLDFLMARDSELEVSSMDVGIQIPEPPRPHYSSPRKVSAIKGGVITCRKEYFKTSSVA